MLCIVANDPVVPRMEDFRDSTQTHKPALEWTNADSEVIESQLSEAQSNITNFVIVAGGETAGDAVVAASHSNAAQGLVLWSPILDQLSSELLSEWDEMPILALANPAERIFLASAVDTYLASNNPTSELFIGKLNDAAMSFTVEWACERLESEVTVSEIALETQDGWQLSGTRSLPKADEPVPAVVLMHTGRSDRSIYTRLERLLARSGFAVLNLDWRGRGKSTNLGTYFELTEETKESAWQDAVAGFDYMASLDEVDETRLAGVGAVHGAEYVARAAWRNPDIRALVILTGYRPLERQERAHLTSTDISVLYVTCSGHQITTDAMKELHLQTPSGFSQYIEYPGAAIGYQLFQIDIQLESRIVDWLIETLSR
ncbi:MAG: hypothetical protein CL759_12160 [Chloroflexi bacterium]|nr:hypothetical protein [Chloroflexota bacterium]|tara:strand:- start:1301 stop:2422 length:1122 start_codon:yes stop_codon:yes gene_type:complete